MHRIKQSLFLLLLLAAASASAERRSLRDMQAIAENHFVKMAGVKSLGGTTAKSLKVDCVYETPDYAVFSPVTSDAYVILSKSDLTRPVIGYSSTPFKGDAMPRDLRWYLSVVSQNIREAEASQIDLREDGLLKAMTPVEPFITTFWHQSDPYNQLTPNNYAAGCVAVAMAQCINYCCFPGRVNFMGYYYTKSGGSRYVADSLKISGFYFYPYLDMYGRATEGQKKSVATLVRDCGYATYMQYSKDGSGTYNYLAGSALVSIFKYPEECVKAADRSTFTSAKEWNDIIYREMQLKSPIIYGGSDETEGGHAFVLCGLDADGLVYVNWGWGGDSNGFYDIALMNPTTFKFSIGQDMIYGIRTKAQPFDHVEPRLSSYDGEPYSFTFTMEKDDDGVEHQTINIFSTRGFYNMTPGVLDGEAGIYGTDLTTGEPWEIKATDPVTFESGSGYYLQEPSLLFYYYVEDEMIPGHTYRLSFGTRDKREGEWHSIMADGGEVAYDVYFTGKEATTTFSERTWPTGVRSIAASKLSDGDGITRVYDLQGRLLYTVATDRFNLWDVPARGALIVKTGNKVRKVVR